MGLLNKLQMELNEGKAGNAHIKVTSRYVRVTIVAVEKQSGLHILCVCLFIYLLTTCPIKR
jgi:hypothetical protein